MDIRVISQGLRSVQQPDQVIQKIKTDLPNALEALQRDLQQAEANISTLQSSSGGTVSTDGVISYA